MLPNAEVNGDRTLNTGDGWRSAKQASATQRNAARWRRNKKEVEVGGAYDSAFPLVGVTGLHVHFKHM